MNLNLHPSITDHWHGQCEELQLSSKDFYAALIKELKAKSFPDVTYELVHLREGGWVSSSREYLIISRFEFRFVICAAPFGRDFFFSWYLKEYLSFGAMLEFVPFFGRWLVKMALRKTYFEVDTEVMFKEGIRRVLDTVIADMTRDKGLRQATRPATASA